jgi:hypothetical protein
MTGNAPWAARNWSAEDKRRFADHASPEAITAELAAARAEKERADDRVSWLETLLDRRVREVTDGTWPSARKPGED